MLKIVELNEGNKAQYEFELAVQNKMKVLEGMNGYESFEKTVQTWIDNHCENSSDGCQAKANLSNLLDTDDAELVNWFSDTDYLRQQS